MASALNASKPPKASISGCASCHSIQSCQVSIPFAPVSARRVALMSEPSPTKRKAWIKAGTTSALPRASSAASAPPRTMGSREGPSAQAGPHSLSARRPAGHPEPPQEAPAWEELSSRSLPTPPQEFSNSLRTTLFGAPDASREIKPDHSAFLPCPRSHRAARRYRVPPYKFSGRFLLSYGEICPTSNGGSMQISF